MLPLTILFPAACTFGCPFSGSPPNQPLCSADGEVLSCCSSTEGSSSHLPQMLPWPEKNTFWQKVQLLRMLLHQCRSSTSLARKSIPSCASSPPSQVSFCLDSTWLCKKRWWITFNLSPLMSLLHPEKQSISHYSLSCHTPKPTKQRQKGSPIHRCPGKHMPCQGLDKTRYKKQGFQALWEWVCFQEKRFQFPLPLFMSTGNNKRKGDVHATRVCTFLPTKQQEVLQKYPEAPQHK